MNNLTGPKPFIEREGFATKLLDPTEKEAMILNNQAVQFMKDLEKNPLKAKQDFKAVILPHMMRALRTVQVLDQELESQTLAVSKLLKANVVLIDILKQKGIDMPNFSEIENDAIREHVERHGDRGII